MSRPQEGADARERALLAYTRQVASIMRLDAWDIGYGEGPPEEAGTAMDMFAQPTRWWVRLRVADVFWTLPPEEQRHVVVHELVHVVQADLWYWFHEREEWRQPLAPALVALIEGRVREELENQADFLARVIARHVPPVPEWP